MELPQNDIYLHSSDRRPLKGQIMMDAKEQIVIVLWSL